MKVKAPKAKAPKVKAPKVPTDQPAAHKAKKSAKILKDRNGGAVSKAPKPSKSKPSWSKVQIAGKLISDDGGAGLEGLLGLEVLENYNGFLSVTKEKPKKAKVIITLTVPHIVSSF